MIHKDSFLLKVRLYIMDGGGEIKNLHKDHSMLKDSIVTNEPLNIHPCPHSELLTDTIVRFFTILKEEIVENKEFCGWSWVSIDKDLQHNPSCICTRIVDTLLNIHNYIEDLMNIPKYMERLESGKFRISSEKLLSAAENPSLLSELSNELSQLKLHWDFWLWKKEQGYATQGEFLSEIQQALGQIRKFAPPFFSKFIPTEPCPIAPECYKTRTI